MRDGLGGFGWRFAEAFGLKLVELFESSVEAAADGVEGSERAAEIVGLCHEDVAEIAGVAGAEAVFEDGGVNAGVAAAEPLEADEGVDQREFFRGCGGEAGVKGGDQFGVFGRIFDADDFGFRVDAGF